MNRRSTIQFVSAAFALLGLVLWLDRAGLPTQLLLSASVWLLLALAFVRHRELARETLIAIAIATTGEVILSIGLGIYGYRSGGVPLYVPPGHGVVYLCALSASAHLQRYERLIVMTTFSIGTLAAIGAAVAFGDSFGFACWIVTLMIASTTDRRLLIATCIPLTSILEIAGTWAGNWTWHEHQGLLGSGNPPVGVVLLYCCLDLLTLMALNALNRRSSRRQNAACSSATSSDETSTSTGLRAA
jgi:hypothetical protein